MKAAGSDLLNLSPNDYTLKGSYHEESDTVIVRSKNALPVGKKTTETKLVLNLLTSDQLKVQ